MSTPFFITGLPRSRTAWFSVATSTPESVCHHEPTAWLSDWPELVRLWTESKFRYVGISDSGLGMLLPSILDELRPRTLIIRRSVDQVETSLNQFGISSPRLRRRLEALQDMLRIYEDHPLVRVIPYEELDYWAVSDAIDWLTPGTSQPMLHQLMHLNIQSDLGYNVEMAHGVNEWWVPDELKE